MTGSCSAKDDEKYLVKGLKRTIKCFTSSIELRAGTMPGSADLWYDDAQIHKMHHLMWVWCKGSDDAQILWCDDAQILGKRERDGTKLGEMQISRESTRRVHRCPASSSHHLCILSNSYCTLRNCTKLQAVCADLASRGSLISVTTWEKITSCEVFSIWKNPEFRSFKLTSQDNHRREPLDNTDRI